MKCPLCGSRFKVIEWHANSELIVHHGQLAGFVSGTPEARFQCLGCSCEMRVRGLKDVNKLMEGALTHEA